MNKKSMIKIGAVSLILVVISIIILIIFLSFSSYAQSNIKNLQKDTYILGEKIKIQLTPTDENIETTIKIKTPSETLIQKTDKSYFLFQPQEIGNYEVIINQDNEKKVYGFEVVSEPVDEKTSKILNQSNNTLKKQIIEIEKPAKITKKILSTETQQENIIIKIPEHYSNLSIFSNSSSIDFKVEETIKDSLMNIFSSNDDELEKIDRLE
jgi:hypothetical protein